MMLEPKHWATAVMALDAYRAEIDQYQAKLIKRLNDTTVTDQKRESNLKALEFWKEQLVKIKETREAFFNQEVPEWMH